MLIDQRLSGVDPGGVVVGSGRAGAVDPGWRGPPTSTAPAPITAATPVDQPPRDAGKVPIRPTRIDQRLGRSQQWRHNTSRDSKAFRCCKRGTTTVLRLCASSV